MLKRLFHSSFVRNVVLVATGTAGAQAITMAFSPIITRLYGPEAFGLLGTFTAVLAILMPIAALTYPIAIVLPKRDDDARAIAKLSLQLAVVISLITAAVFLMGDRALAQLLGLQTISSFLLLIPLAMLFNAMQQVMQQWLIRKKEFKVSARIAVSQSLILNSTKAGVGPFYPAGAALILLATLGNALYAAQLWFGARRWSNVNDHINQVQDELPKAKTVAYQHRDFPIYRMPQVMINFFSTSIPVFVLAGVFGPATAGFYTLSRTVMSSPAQLLGKSVGNVFYAQIAELVNAGKDPRRYLYRATVGAFLVAVIPFSIVMVWGVPLFKLVFGAEWSVAGEYARWVALWMLFSLAARPAIAIIPVINAQGWFLRSEIVFTVLKVTAILLGALVLKNALYAVALYASISTIFYIYLYIFLINRMMFNFI